MSATRKISSSMYVIVGAGASGLAAARWFTAAGLPFQVLESHRDVGGLWDFARGDTPLYQSARFISSRTMSAFHDFPMPADYPDYPHHPQILAYLRAYADRFDLRRRIRFGARVERAEPVGEDRDTEGGWRVTLAGGETLTARGLVVANGHNWDLRVPEWAASNGASASAGGSTRTGGIEVKHARAYRTPDELRGRRVLIVGGGNSGCDIACDASRHAERAWFSVRRGYWFIPKHIFGKPADVFAHQGPQLPMRIAQPVFELLLRILVGDLRRAGLPRPDHRIFETHPIMNTQVVEELKAGRLTAKGDVRGLHGDRVLFADGSEERVDLVILATGYRHSIPFLGEDVFRAGDRRELYLNVFHRRLPTLFVVGLFENDGAAFPLIDLQCRLVAALLRARAERSPGAAHFDTLLHGPPPDLTEGVRHLPLERMSTYVMTKPYEKALRRALAALAPPGGE